MHVTIVDRKQNAMSISKESSKLRRAIQKTKSLPTRRGLGRLAGGKDTEF